MKKTIVVAAIIAVMLVVAGVKIVMAQWAPPATIPTFGNATTGSTTQTYTNSPCTASTTAEWIPVHIYGTSSDPYYIAACH